MISGNVAAERMRNVSTAKLITRPCYHSYYKSQAGFDRALLPMPIKVLAQLGMKPKKANAAGYWLLRCPFHKNGGENTPSLNMHQVNGNFRCHACNARGGDVLSFYRQFTGKNFKESAVALGAWRAKI